MNRLYSLAPSLRIKDLIHLKSIHFGLLYSFDFLLRNIIPSPIDVYKTSLTINTASNLLILIKKIHYENKNAYSN